MSELVAFSFDGEASPGLTVRASRPSREREPYGWGFGWYPDEEPTGVIIKDPAASSSQAMSSQLREWETFRSTIFICHLRGATRKARQRDAQPFMKAYAGRNWIFAHNGDLQGDLDAHLPLGVHPVFEPVGRTDSEHAFCWLLTALRAEGARSLADFGWDNLARLFDRINATGTANLLLTDGHHLAVHHDANSFHTMHWIRRVPPHAVEKLASREFTADLDGVLERNRTMVIFSTKPLSKESWRPMQGGQMMVARRGGLVWSSHSWDEDDVDVMAGQAGLEEAVPTQAGPRPQATQLPATGTGAPAAAGTGAPPAPSVRPGSGPAVAADPPSERTLSVLHSTRYRYEQLVEHSAHLFRLAPVHDERQHCLRSSLELSVNGSRNDFEDVFGNNVTHLEVNSPFEELFVLSRFAVTIHQPPPLSARTPSRRDTLPLVWMPWQRQMMLPYLLPPELHESELQELSDYAMSFVDRNDRDLLDTVLDINSTIYKDYSYVSGSTTLETTPYEVYTSRRGVCQDFANLFICMARLLSVPARYRVGYIYTGGNYENKIQSEASHAWIELYLPWNGWCGFDPTNGCLAGLDHVRVACGRNYRDATPTAGTIFKGGGGEELDVDVKVEELTGD